MKKERYIVEKEMPDGDASSSMYIQDIIQTDCDIENEGRWKVFVKEQQLIEQLTAFAVHLNKRGAFRDDLCMDFEHEAQSFIEMQNNKEL